MVTWNELIPALELLIYGSMEDKIRCKFCCVNIRINYSLVAFALVDINGDGEVSQVELNEFWRECFLPIVQFVKVSLL